MDELTDQQFIINVGPQGTFRRSGSYHTLPEHIDTLFHAFEQAETKRIAIFFHGGLVGESSGLESARNMAPHLLAAGCTPICFVWETGLVETISTNISKIGETSLFHKLLKLLLKKVSQKIGFDLPTGRGNGQGLTNAQIEAELSRPDPFREYDHLVTTEAGRGGTDLEILEAQDRINKLKSDLYQELEREIENDLALKQEVKNTTLSSYSTDDQTGSRGIISIASFVAKVASIAYKIIKRFIAKRDHGLYPTVVEEILRQFYVAELGAWVWNAMKEKSDRMWGTNDGREGLERYVGRYFLDKLAAYKNTFPDTQLNLVGHSAGSIAICNLLKQTADQQQVFSFNHVIFLAPACRTELFDKHALAEPKRFNDIRIFTMSDENECRDTLVPFVYTRSLLYLISGILEDEGKSFDAPILGLQRHIAFSPPYDTEEYRDVHEYTYMAGSNRTCFSQTVAGSSAGLQTQSLKHGNFDNDTETLASITNILSS